MPRRNKPIKHTRYSPINNDAKKVRYPNKKAAENAAEIRMLQTPGLELSVYQGNDNGWYLTRRLDNN